MGLGISVIMRQGSTGRWMKNGMFYEDYKKAFGEEPPMISGVAIMTDTDNTGESAIAYYGDILFSKTKSQ